MAQALIIISLHEMTQTNVESKTGQFKRRVNQFEIVVKSLAGLNVQFKDNGNFKVLVTMKLKNRYIIYEIFR